MLKLGFRPDEVMAMDREEMYAYLKTWLKLNSPTEGA